MLKKPAPFKFEFKIIALMSIILILVIGTGFGAYFRYSYLLQNISKSIRSDSRISLFHSLKNNLADLSNITKTHSLIEDDVYKINYGLVKNEIQQNLLKIKNINLKSSNKIDINQLDSLIADRLVILDGIMYAEDLYRVQTALGKVVSNIDDAEKSTSNFDVKNTSTSNSSNDNNEIDYKLIQENQKKLELLEKEEKRLVRKIKRAEKFENISKINSLDSLLNIKQKEAKKIHRKLTKEEEYEKDKRIAVNQIFRGIENVSKEELAIEKENKLNQLELVTMDHILGLRIVKLLDKFELSEVTKIAKATQYAELENKRTAKIIGYFGAFVAILILFVIYIISRYVNNSRNYSKALKRSASETEKLVKTRERLIATISHEIRTPMHAISGFAEQLSKGHLSNEQNEYVSMIQKSSKHLTYLINDVLDLSKLQSEKLKLNFQPFNFKELINDALIVTKELMQNSSIEMSSDIDENVADYYSGDVFRLRQILLNLLGNAVKFTENGRVTVNVSLLKSDDVNHVISIKVTDTGIGMTTEQLSTIFSEFEQYNYEIKPKISGTGLGLPITKKLVELHKGIIKIESEKDKGTTVEVVLELKKVDAIEEKVIQKKIELSCSSVLIVDDEEYNRKLIKAVLSPYNIQLFESENGEEALTFLNKKNVDLVLLDARMPVMDGRKTIHAIRESEKDHLKLLKVILLTAAENEISDILDKVNGYVSKPFNEEKLLVEINRVLKNESIMTYKNPTSIVDFTNLRTLSGNDSSFYIDMLQTFVSSTSNSFDFIQSAFINDDWEMLANESHKIASPCRHLGAYSLHKMLKDIEQSARENKNTAQLKQQMKVISDEMNKVLQEINKELSTHK